MIASLFFITVIFFLATTSLSLIFHFVLYTYTTQNVKERKFIRVIGTPTSRNECIKGEALLRSCETFCLAGILKVNVSPTFLRKRSSSSFLQIAEKTTILTGALLFLLRLCSYLRFYFSYTFFSFIVLFFYYHFSSCVSPYVMSTSLFLSPSS